MCSSCGSVCEGKLCEGCQHDVYAGSDDAMWVVDNLIAKMEQMKKYIAELEHKLTAMAPREDEEISF